jgi:spermidine synthase
MAEGEADWREFSLAPGERAAFEVRRVLYQGRTRCQSVEIAETVAHGIVLFLDGQPQSATSDEFIYHEALVHPALVAHPRPRKVLIVGGGEGATLREVLRHPGIERAVMVDIDGELVEIAREHLAAMHRGAFDDPRAEVIIQDGLAFLRDHEDRFDAIILDLTDPTEHGPAASLYGEPFFRLASSRLEPDGIIATQAYAFVATNLRWFTAIARTLARVRPIVRPYRAEIPSFKDSWGFCTASSACDPAALGELSVNAILDERQISDLGFYDGVAHESMFKLPKYARMGAM